MATAGDFVSVPVPRATVATAQAHAVQRMQAAEYERAPNLTPAQHERKIAAGAISQILLRERLTAAGFAVDTDFAHVAVDFATPAALRVRFEALPEKRLDVRTQTSGAVPTGNWFCEITRGQVDRDVDAAVFAKLRDELNPRTVYFVGWMTMGEFRAVSRPIDAGERLPGPGGAPATYDLNSVSVGQLLPMADLDAWLRR